MVSLWDDRPHTEYSRTESIDGGSSGYIDRLGPHIYSTRKGSQRNMIWRHHRQKISSGIKPYIYLTNPGKQARNTPVAPFTNMV